MEILSAYPSPSMNPYGPAAPAFTPSAAARLDPAAGGSPLEASPIQALGQQALQFVGLLVNLLGGLLQNGQGAPPPVDNANGAPPPVDNANGGPPPVDNANGAPPPVNGGTRNEGGTPPVNGGNASNMAGTTGHDVAPNASGTAFPVVGYKGKIDLHHGSSHGGADLMAPRGTPIVAMRGGTVESVGSSGAGGNSVQIKGDDGLTYYYAHMDQAPSVSQGQKVKTGMQIGVVGDSGNAKGTGTHLHLGIGHGIQSGTGPDGGTGSSFDATSYLQQSLAAQNG